MAMGGQQGQFGLSIIDEFSDTNVGDLRLAGRLEKVVQSVIRCPSHSFPNMFAEPSELEGAYRLFTNQRIEWKQIFEAHKQKSFSRASEHQVVVVAHDTTP
ncbi:MAG: hypothetical protein HY537_13390 [Deltaproteobacteria bacterium]|nr:hypothetical protein [Deltaproteobacteria bacterium]